MGTRVGRRIIIVGSSNAGKTTLATHLSKRLNVPLIELDALHWEPGWVEADDSVFRDRIRRAMSPDAWVMDGNYIRQQQLVSWPVADTIVWLDLGMKAVLRRCLHRCWRRWRSQEVLYGDNRERLWEHLMLWDADRSLFAHILTTHRSRRQRYLESMRDPRWWHLTYIRLRSEDEVNHWLESVTT